MIDLNNSIPVNPLFVWTVPEEYYTIAQTCQMLHITTRRINAYMDGSRVHLTVQLDAWI